MNENKERISDEAFLRGAIAGLIAILLCLVALCSTTYAWFLAESRSGASVISGSRYSLSVTLTDENGDPVPVTDRGNDTFFCALKSGKTYTVSLQTSADTTATRGYCSISVLGVEKHTESISLDKERGRARVTFFVSVADKDVSVVLESRMGIPAVVDILDGDTWTIGHGEN